MCSLLLGGNYFRRRGRHHHLMLSDWVLLNYWNKPFRRLTHSLVLFIKSDGEWFVNGLHFMAQLVVKYVARWKDLNTNNYTGTCIIHRRRAGVWSVYIFIFSILVSWFFESLKGIYSSNTSQNKMLPFCCNIKSLKTPLEILMNVAQLTSSTNYSKAEYQRYLVANT